MCNSKKHARRVHELLAVPSECRCKSPGLSAILLSQTAASGIYFPSTIGARFKSVTRDEEGFQVFFLIIFLIYSFMKVLFALLVS